MLTADRELKHVKLADETIYRSCSIGKKPFKYPDDYCHAEVTNADAIHPGYGFLSENANFAEQVEKSGLSLLVQRLM